MKKNTEWIKIVIIEDYCSYKKRQTIEMPSIDAEALIVGGYAKEMI